MFSEVLYKTAAMVCSGISRVRYKRMINIVSDLKSERILRQYIHICPICEKKHFVNEVRHQLAYGKHYCCSIDCEIKIRKAWRA